MKHVFKAEKMLDRIRKEGCGDLLDEQTVEFIKSLDGKEADDYNWRSQVHGEPVGWIEECEVYVNIHDCE